MNLSKFNLKNKNALITGAAGLLGIEHAKALLECNANVVITDINKENLRKIKETLLSLNLIGKIDSYIMDVTKIESIERVKNKLKSNNRNIDILINNAAINPIVDKNKKMYPSRLEHFSNFRWDLEIAVGLTGAFNCSKIFGNEMVQNEIQGIIINIASDLSVIAPNQNLYKRNGIKEENQDVKPVTYSVIKHGLIGLTKYLATYWAGKGIRCNSLSPGGILNNQGDEFLEKINDLIPLGRMAFKDEYKSAIQFLSSEASSYLNGHNLVIDGGRSVW